MTNTQLNTIQDVNQYVELCYLRQESIGYYCSEVATLCTLLKMATDQHNSSITFNEISTGGLELTGKDWMRVNLMNCELRTAVHEVGGDILRSLDRRSTAVTSLCIKQVLGEKQSMGPFNVLLIFRSTTEVWGCLNKGPDVLR